MRARDLLKHFDIELNEFGDERAKTRCPRREAHANEDEHPSCEISLSSGSFKCHACGLTGDVIDFVAMATSSTRAAILSMAEQLGGADDESVVDVTIPERWHQALLQNPAAMKLLEQRKGLTMPTVVKYRLGYTGNRFSMPVYSGDGRVMNVRQWSPTDKERKVIGIPGHNKRRLYPIAELEHDVVCVVEGEMKALLLIQLGFHALSPTAGAGTWSRDWGELFKDKIVVVMYDIDKRGREGALRVCQSVSPHARMVKDVVLPLAIEDYPHGDVTDYVVKAGHSADDVRRVIRDAKPWTATPLVGELEQDEQVYDVSLGASSEAKYYGKLVRVSCVVSAKDTAPFTVPKKFQVRCLRNQDYCAFCPICTMESDAPEIEIGDKDPVLLELVNIKLDKQPFALRKAARIPAMCRLSAFVPTEMFNVEEVRLIPQLKIAENGSEHVVRRAFYVGHGIETNTSYEIEAKCMPEPNTQYATLLIYKAQAQVDSLSKFKITPLIRSELSAFQCDPTDEAIDAKLHDIYTDMERNVTRIRQRHSLHQVYDLVYHSVLYVPFQGQVHKGWVEALVLGDSSQGKSAALTAMMRHYSLGEKIDCKGSSVAGLLGGLQETAKRWFISWGVITLNDRRLVALEEAKGMTTDTIAKMTDARSSGVVEISKIEKAKTTCRCRLIWISNSRSGRKLDTYNYGVEAVRELIGSLEDVRRFDLAVTLASKDVPEEVINARIEALPDVQHTYTSDRCRDLILWAWSRRADQVVFEDDAVDEILNTATAMGKKYTSSIPLVESADQRLKLARLSASMAARLYSTDDGERLIVRAAHVRSVTRFLQSIYDSTSFGYLEYSNLLLGEVTLDDEPVVRKAVLELSYAKDTINALLNTSVISNTDLLDWAGLTFDEARNLTGLLVRKRALKRYRSAYVKTPAFLKLLKELRDSADVKEPPAPRHEEEL